MPLPSVPTFLREISRIAFIWLVGFSLASEAQESRNPDRTVHLAMEAKPASPRASAPRASTKQPSPAVASNNDDDQKEGEGSYIFHARPGPWGDLEYFTVYLEASVSMLKSMDFQTYDTTWSFVKWTEDQVAKLFESAKIAEPFRTELLDRTKWRRTPEGITVNPSREALLGLSGDSRAVIYQVLGRWEENPFHHEPMIIAGNDVREWLKRAQLPEDVLATIERTVYQRSRNLVFADLPLILRMVTSEAERLKIRKALSRTPTLVVKLRLTPQTDVAKIAEYWGGYSKSKDVEPFLDSISNNPVVNLLDIIYLLPTGVRRLLCTYPGQNHGRTGYYPDCHWTSLNFANFEPLARLADATMATAYTLENYTRITGGTYQYGDVLFFMDGTTGNAIHSCVYIADDIVYTKNGRSPTQPWVLMKLDDVVSLYSMFYQTQIACYRRKSE